MPLGISERIIKEAYGPSDFSGVYNRLDAAAKKYEAEERLRRQADQKEYYTNLATLNKDITGVRAIDLPRVTDLYNQFANVSKKQINVSMSSNPTLYGQLENEKRTLQSKIKTISEGSKQLAKMQQENGEKMSNPTTKYDYIDNAYQSYIEKTNKPYEDVIRDGGYDLSNFFRKDVDTSDLFKNIKNDIFSKGLERHVVDETKTVNGVPQIFKNEYDKFPNFDKIHYLVQFNLQSSFKSPGQREAAINQELKRMVDSKEADRINAEFEAKLGSPDFRKKYNIQNYQPLPEPKTNRDRLEMLLAKKEFLSNLPTAPSKPGTGEFRSKIEQMQTQAGITRSNIRLAADLRQQALDKGLNDVVKYTGIIENINKGIKSGSSTEQKIAYDNLKNLEKAAPRGTELNMFKLKQVGGKFSKSEGLNALKSLLSKVSSGKIDVVPGKTTAEEIKNSINSAIKEYPGAVSFSKGNVSLEDVVKGFTIAKFPTTGGYEYKIYSTDDEGKMIQDFKKIAPKSVQKGLSQLSIETSGELDDL